MQSIDRSAVIRLASVRADLQAGGSGKVLSRGTLDLKLNMLTPPNKKATHEQDEIYVVMKGRGVFVSGESRDSFEEGDFLFVAAGVEHYFTDFDQLTLWRIYFGVKGGEMPAKG